jgi:hypothetical protein
MSNFRVNKLAFALALSSSSALALAQYQDANSLQVDVTGSREGGQSILTPTKILAGDELQNKLGATLGATLANELGVSATGYGSGASDRFDKRRDLIMSELSTMSSAYLSIDLLKAEDQPKLRELLKQYIDLRLQVYKKPMQLEDQAKIFQQRVDVGNQIWQTALKSVNNISSLNFADKLIAAKILPTINAMFDAADTQRIAMRIHPPLAMWILLFLLAFVGSLVAGYIMGVEERRDWLLTAVFIVMMVATISLILDIEHPRDGMINLDRIDQEIIQFRKSI